MSDVIAVAPPRHGKLKVLFVAAVLICIVANFTLLGLASTGYVIGLFRLLYFIYVLNALCLPGLVLLAGVAGAVALRRGARARWIKVCTAFSLGSALFVWGVTIYATQIEPGMLDVEHVTIVTDKLTKPLRILHISDIQTPRIGAYEKRAFEIMREQKPDLVIETGDTLQMELGEDLKRGVAEITPLFESLKPPMGMFHCQGDVDYGLRGLRETGGLGGMKFLYNEEVTLAAPDGTPVHLLCLDIANSRRPGMSLPVVEPWFKSHREGLTLLAGHGPDFVLEVKDLPIDLCLAGHTHGGQVSIPFFGPPMILSAIPRWMARGFHEYGATRINVCPGIGAEHVAGLPAIRFNCPPSMTVIDFVPRKQD